MIVLVLIFVILGLIAFSLPGEGGNYAGNRNNKYEDISSKDV